jgi:hypothetical protein
LSTLAASYTVAMKSTDMPNLAGTVAQLEKGVGSAAQTPKRQRREYEKAWPDDVWCIGLDRLDLLGVDSRGELYWDGKAIEVRRPLSLSWWQRVGAVIIAGSALVGASAAAVSAYAAFEAIPAPINSSVDHSQPSHVNPR